MHQQQRWSGPFANIVDLDAGQASLVVMERLGTPDCHSFSSLGYGYLAHSLRRIATGLALLRMESVVCFSTKICGRSRRAEEIPATPPKFFEEGSRGGRRKEGLAAAREHLDENHARATARASARQHTRGIRPNIRLLLEIGGRRGDIEKCAGRLGPG